MFHPILFALLFSPDVFGYRVIDTTRGVTLLTFENETVNLQCKTDIPNTNCGFIHPSGKKYISFSGPGMNDGRCTLKLKATKIDSGEWRCHIGREAIGVELIQYIQVRVVGEVAAILPNVTAVYGQPITLECATAKSMTPLSSCSFEPPNGGAPFSISPAVTSINPIQGRYYYPLNKSLDRGDCAVTIRNVTYDDVGLWTCGAGLYEDGKKHTDVINLDVEGSFMEAVVVMGITFGAIGIAALLLVLGIVVWKKCWFLGTFMQNKPEIIEIQELGPRPRSPRNPRVSPQPKREIPIIILQSPSEDSTHS